MSCTKRLDVYVWEKNHNIWCCCAQLFGICNILFAMCIWDIVQFPKNGQQFSQRASQAREPADQIRGQPAEPGASHPSQQTPSQPAINASVVPASQATNQPAECLKSNPKSLPELISFIQNCHLCWSWKVVFFVKMSFKTACPTNHFT